MARSFKRDEPAIIAMPRKKQPCSRGNARAQTSLSNTGLCYAHSVQATPILSTVDFFSSQTSGNVLALRLRGAIAPSPL
jgi:hypothetical protein